MQRARRAQHVHAVAAAHLEVAQHDVEVAVVQPLDGGVAVRRFLDLVPGFGQPAHQPAAQRIVIVGNQNSTHDPSLASFYLNQPDRARRHRQRHPEARAGLRAAAEVDAPVVRVDDLPDDRQPEAGAL